VSEAEIPDLTTAHYTTIAVESTQKRGTIPQNLILVHIRPATPHDHDIFQQAASCTSEQLADAWMTWAEIQTQQDLPANHSSHATHAFSISITDTQSHPLQVSWILLAKAKSLDVVTQQVASDKFP